jgi:hypothetical protein
MFAGIMRMLGMGKRHSYGWGRSGHGWGRQSFNPFGARQRGGFYGMSRGPMIGGGALPVVGYMLWRNRGRIGSWVQGLRGGHMGRGLDQGVSSGRSYDQPGASAF